MSDEEYEELLLSVQYAYKQKQYSPYYWVHNRQNAFGRRDRWTVTVGNYSFRVIYDRKHKELVTIEFIEGEQ